MKKFLVFTVFMFVFACNNSLNEDPGNYENEEDNYSEKIIYLRDVPDQSNPLFSTLAEVYDSLEFGIDSIIVYDISTRRKIYKQVLYSTITLDNLERGIELGTMPYNRNMLYLFYFTGVDSVMKLNLSINPGYLQESRIFFCRGYLAIKGHDTTFNHILITQQIAGDSVSIVNSMFYSADVIFWYADSSIYNEIRKDTLFIYVGPSSPPGIGFQVFYW